MISLYEYMLNNYKKEIEVLSVIITCIKYDIQELRNENNYCFRRFK
jgi:hypothetical protein